MQSKAANYPASEGWIRMDATLNSSKALSEDDLKKIASFGKPGSYEWGPVSQNGKRLRAVMRQKPAEPKPA